MIPSPFEITGEKVKLRKKSSTSSPFRNLEIIEAVLVHCNYLQDSKILWNLQ